MSFLTNNDHDWLVKEYHHLWATPQTPISPEVRRIFHVGSPHSLKLGVGNLPMEVANKKMALHVISQGHEVPL